MKNGFYGLSVFESLGLDYFKYRGMGRPRKSDYSTYQEMQDKINILMIKLFDKRSKYLNI